MSSATGGVSRARTRTIAAIPAPMPVTTRAGSAAGLSAAGLAFAGVSDRRFQLFARARSAAETGVRDRATLQAWIERGAPRAAAASMPTSCAMRIGGGDRRYRGARAANRAASRPTAETGARNRGSRARHFSATCRAAWPEPVLDRWARSLASSARRGRSCYAAALAPARRAPASRSNDALRGYLQAFAANLVSAGLRLGHHRADRWAAHPGRAGAGHRRRRSRGSLTRDPSRFRQRDLCRRPRLDGARNPIFEAVPLMSAPKEPAARRHRRPGRLRQDRADGPAVQARCAAATRSPRSPTTSTPTRTPSS